VPARGTDTTRTRAVETAAPAPTASQEQPAVAPPPSTTPAPAPAPTSSSSYAATASTDKGRSYAAGRYTLVLDGAQMNVMAVEGGAATAEVVVEKAGSGPAPKKHIAGIRYEEISVNTGLDSKPILDWVAATWKGNYQRKNGSVLGLDYNYKIRSEREFTDALITETTFPALDAASGKEAGYLTVKIAPEVVRMKPGSGADAKGSIGAKQKMWLPSNFRFEMDGLDGDRVARIEPITVGQKVATNQVGEFRDYEKTPTSIEFSNLKISLSEAGAQSWFDWHDDFVVKGNNGDDKEKNGAIVFLTTDRKNELGRINLFNCGIYRLAPAPQAPGRDAISRLMAELYCERMELEAKGPGA
jgi:hypothetical protein